MAYSRKTFYSIVNELFGLIGYNLQLRLMYSVINLAKIFTLGVKCMRSMRLGRVALVTAILSVACFGQNNPPEGRQIVKLQGGEPIPRYVLYHQFFRHLIYLDDQSKKLAAANSSEGASKLASYYQSQLHFTPAQFASVRSIANSTEAQIGALDAQAKAIIKEFRSQFSGRISIRNTVPAAPTELAQLQQKRDSLIENEIAALNNQLGPNRLPC